MSANLTSLIEARLLWAMHHRALPPGDDWKHPVPANALWLMLSGAAEVIIDGQRWKVPSGAAFLADCRNGRDIVIAHHAEWLTVGLQSNLLGRDLLSLIGLPVLWVPDEASHHALEFCLRELTRVCKAEGAASLVSDGLSRALTGLILEAHGINDLSPASRGDAPSWLGRVLLKARDNPGIGVAELSHEAGFSPAQFRRVFHAWAGMSPHDFLQRERLELARRLLEGTEFPIEEISQRCGFCGASSFARTFRTFAGFSPAAYRQIMRRMPQQQA